MKIFALLLMMTVLMFSCVEDQKIAPTVEAPKYETLLGEGLSGSGFHFRYQNQNYLACSLHQFDGKQPRVMASMSFDGVIKIGKLVHQQKDVQVLRYNSSELDKTRALNYSGKAKIKAGDPVYLYHFDEAFLGHIISLGDKESEYEIEMAIPYPASGNSGSPIVSAKTGDVIGVLLSADSGKAATRVGFEALHL